MFSISPLVESKKMLPPLHIKFGHMKKIVKATDKIKATFKYV